MANNTKQVGGSASSFTLDLFGPKDSSSSPPSTGLFGSVFGPPSTGLGKEANSYSGYMGTTRRQNLESQYQYGTGKHEISDNVTYRGKGESGGLSGKDKNSVYQNESVEPCYFSSSIHYGGQEVYSPTGQTSVSPYIFKKDGGDDNSASRGNWWEGSLYY